MTMATLLAMLVVKVMFYGYVNDHLHGLGGADCDADALWLS